MVVQPRGDRLRLFRQHDHALACGHMALEWSRSTLSWDALVAIGIHDCGWIPEDDVPRVNPDTGGPFDFIHMPLSDRVDVYVRSIVEAERVSPKTGLLVSTHFASFLSTEAAPEFVAAEAARRLQLEAAVGTERVASVATEYAALKALDLLSLAACMTPPGSDAHSHPRWLTGTVGIAGMPTSFSWIGESALQVDPLPFHREVELALPYVEIDRRRYESDDDLQAAVRDGLRGESRVRIS